MDAMVLRAQQWLNATYRTVSGIPVVAEDGTTGWSTMYALTRALQHELGITALSDAFGPATLAALTAHGNISASEANLNIVKIAQCALYCKGYPGGAIDGTYPRAAVAAMMVDAGLENYANNNDLPPKVFKAMLTMDAYVVVETGYGAVRSIQQWLNARYFPRKNFFVIPCDGIFSRDVQKALYLAIQFELGMTDDQATGVFGPGTQAGLKSHLLSVGSSGVFVQIMTASMVFNRVRLISKPASPVYLKFTSSYDSEVSQAVKDFQQFSALNESGSVDFATWCQLLVSTGDPNRPAQASDCIKTVTDARAKALHAAGYRIVGRYLDERPSNKWLGKQIQPGELQTIFSNGLKVFPISQYNGGEVGYFNYTQGYTDAVAAHDAASGYGFARGVTIYFAVDYDATDPEISSAIIPYFNGVVAGLAARGKKYLHGVYGSRNVCARVSRETHSRWSFVSGMSTGFSGNMGFPLPANWSFNQIQTLWIGSGDGAIDIDKDAYRAGTDPACGSVNDSSNPVDGFLNYVDQLYSAAASYRNTYPNKNLNANTLVTQFMRSTEYDDMWWDQLVGPVDEDFLAYVRDRQIQRMEYFPEPFYGLDFKVRHFAAVVEGAVYNANLDSVAGRADICGWGGDWATLYAEWRRDSDSYSSGYDYCRAKLFSSDPVVGAFKIRDLLEDSDAYNIGMKIRAGGNIAGELRANLQAGGGHLTRFKRFYEGRFGGSAATAKALAKNMLLPGDDVFLNSVRVLAIQSVGDYEVIPPHLLPADKLDEFCKGFADMLLLKVGQENAQ